MLSEVFGSLNMHRTGGSLHGWLDLRHINTVWRWLTPMRPPPPQHTHTQAHVWASSFCSNTPCAPWERTYLRATLGFVCECMCVLLPCVGSCFSQKCLSSSSRLMSWGENTTLTTSVWPVRPSGEAQICINLSKVTRHPLLWCPLDPGSPYFTLFSYISPQTLDIL